MTKKILALVVALVIMSTCGMVAFAAETPTDVPEIVLQLEANGAKGKMEDIPVNEAGVVVVPEHAFTNDNFKFTGWNTTADGAGFDYAPGDEIVLKETLVLYAQWIHKDAQYEEFTIIYDANGGTGETVDEWGPYISGGYAYTAWNYFYKAGAEFIGWNTEKDGSGTMYGEDEMFEIYENVTLYAIWEGGEEEIIEKPDVNEEIEEDVVSDTNANPETGSKSVAGAVVAGVVALGALAILKKRG